jgi:hypothetical protein
MHGGNARARRKAKRNGAEDKQQDVKEKALAPQKDYGKTKDRFGWFANNKVTAVTVVISVLGIGGIVDYYKPHISVRGDDLFDATRPFSARFVIKNEGHFAVKDVVVYCGPDLHDSSVGTVSGIGFLLPQNRFDRLNSGQEATANCARAVVTPGMKPRYEQADIALVLHYTYFGLKESEAHPFQGLQDEDGHMHFTPRATVLSRNFIHGI